jgi:DNA-binding transcriptional ArsR family regulator
MMIDATLHALSDPTRRAILARLALGEATAGDLGQPFAMSQPAVSQHLKVLESAGLILRRIDGPRRPCRLAPEGLAALEDWLTALRRAFEVNYARLDDILTELDTKEPPT